MHGHEFTISLGVRHPSMDPARITHEFGLEPGHVWRNGESRTGPTGAALPGSHRGSYWACEIAARPGFPGERIGVDQELARLLDKLRAATGFIQELQHSGGATELLLTIFPHGDCRMELSPEMSSLLGLMGIRLEIEIRSGEIPTPPEARS